MPRRYYEYIASYETLNQIATVGAITLGISLFITLGYLIWGAIWGEPAGRNPWNAMSLEWKTETPPIEHNFHDQLTVAGGPYEYPIDEGDDGPQASEIQA